jgi:hypothetical protein
MSEVIYLKEILLENIRKKKKKVTAVRRKLKPFDGSSLKSSIVEKKQKEETKFIK